MIDEALQYARLNPDQVGMPGARVQFTPTER